MNKSQKKFVEYMKGYSDSCETNCVISNDHSKERQIFDMVRFWNKLFDNDTPSIQRVKNNISYFKRYKNAIQLIVITDFKLMVEEFSSICPDDYEFKIDNRNNIGFFKK